ncbi:MFS transporter [Beijerinckia indica]|uniref:Major facilitator superfamily MFS_1 n=1 Tax=Beijerinckia indica subsp. indica (strain ATCC 9039 / DSM 1715 / NCIMB 8712) TaxID=395963 RepID=B2IBW1_BEII9|nr:MFS transporter [Beijerinckia indica]ACB93833.1 major facilitator superfamily MFS_1 [Beijerinckia indica subsp. indica ATCC 9039]
MTTQRADSDVENGAGLKFLVFASSLGTMIEWYDFFLYGSLAVFFSELFYPKDNPVAALLISVATFATGFAVRPLGAVLFGHLGDRIGRKTTFLITLLLMGGATALIGILPTYASVGLLAPVLLVVLRLIQGLALGGEYGGAATYVAEHAPDGRRGGWTSAIQTMASMGFFVSLAVVLSCRFLLGDAIFASWGWRIPFLLSAVLVMLSLGARLRLAESPIFLQLKAEDRVSKSPVRESFADPRNRRLMLAVLFGVASGQAVTFYTANFYALYFLQSILKVDFLTSNLVMVLGVLIGMPLFVLFGIWSDKIGRKPLIIAGMAAAVVLLVPIFMVMQSAVGPQGINIWLLAACVFVLVAIAAAVYGPYAAYLVEVFPPQIRYTSLSIPYHIGNGIFGGFLPLIGLSLVAATGNPLAGLIYPIAVCVINVIIGSLYLPETLHTPIDGRTSVEDLADESLPFAAALPPKSAA